MRRVFAVQHIPLRSSLYKKDGARLNRIREAAAVVPSRAYKTSIQSLSKQANLYPSNGAWAYADGHSRF